MSAKNLGESINDTLQRFRLLAPIGLIIPDFDIDQLSGSALNEEDLTILSENHDGNAPWIDGKTSVKQIAWMANRQNVSVGDILKRLQRFQRLNLDIFSGDPEQFADLKVDYDDLFLLSGPSSEAWPKIHASVGRIACAAFEAEKPVGEILQRLQRFSKLGLMMPRIDPNQFNELMVTEDDLILLSDDYNKGLHTDDVSWLDQKVSTVNIRKAAKKLNKPVEVILKRLQKFAPLGLIVPTSMENELL
jgi:hypothetical protein